MEYVPQTDAATEPEPQTEPTVPSGRERKTQRRVPAHRDGPFLLSQLRIGCEDKRGRAVTDVIWASDDFKIYRTREGIGVHFSDDRDTCLAQTKQYLALGSELAHMHHLLGCLEQARQPPLARWFCNERQQQNLQRSREREIARGIAQALTGDPAQGKATLKALGCRVEKNLRNRARVRYLGICVLATVAIGLAASGLWLASEQNHFKELALAAICGSIGALLSTAAGLRNLRPDATAGLFMSWIFGGQRMLVGVLGAVVLYFALRSGVLVDILPGVGAAPPANQALEPFKLAFLSVLAGFSERLVPDLLDRNAGNGKAGPAGEAVDAAG